MTIRKHASLFKSITPTLCLALLIAATTTIGLAEAASSKGRHSVIRDHRGPNAAPSGGVTVDGRGWKVQPPSRGCHHVGNCPRRPGVFPKGSRGSRPVVRDHRKPAWPKFP
jgi:hypothetical protein